MLYLLYLALSLFDPWGYLADGFHLAAFGLLFVAMMILILRGLMARGFLPLRPALRLTILSLLLAASAGIWAGPDAKRRLEVAVKPRALFTYPTPEITMAVTPPAYSGRASFTERLDPAGEILTNPAANPAPVPEGSRILVRVGNIPYAPTLISGDRQIPFLAAESGGYVAEFTVTAQTDWRINQGSHQIGRWPLVILEDEAPVIGRAEFHQMADAGGLFGLSLALSDDYGIETVSVAAGPSKAGDPAAVQDRLVLPVRALKKFDGDVFVDLTASAYVGKVVDLVIEARDGAGQIQHRVIEDITLPQKVFRAPLARKIIEIRDGIRQRPEERLKLARQLMALGLTPDDGRTPPVFYMALRSAYWRLTKATDGRDVDSALGILWDLAERLEEGASGSFRTDMLARLAALKLATYQRQGLPEIRRQLQEIDKAIILFLRREDLSARERPIDVKALRNLYSKILLHTHHKRTGRVIGLISYLEHGFIHEDKGILSGEGVLRFQAAHQARSAVQELEKIQRRILTVSLRNSVKLELASATSGGEIKMPARGDMSQWIAAQKKLGDNISDLGRDLIQSGIDASRLTVPAGDLVRDTLDSLAAGDMETASQYQSQIMTLLDSLKKLLDAELRFDPMGRSGAADLSP